MRFTILRHDHPIFRRLQCVRVETINSNMAVSEFISTLRGELSSGAKVLSDCGTEEFKSALQRWSDLNTRTPAAIVVIATEEDIVKTVC